MVDKLDQRLINILEHDAYQSTAAIAKQLGVSTSTIRRRTRRLIQQKILRIIGSPDPNRMGLPLTAIIALDVSHEDINSVTQQLADRLEVKWVSVTSGRFDVIILGWFSSTEKAYEFLEVVGSLAGVKNTETFFCLHIVKS